MTIPLMGQEMVLPLECPLLVALGAEFAPELQLVRFLVPCPRIPPGVARITAGKRANEDAVSGLFGMLLEGVHILELRVTFTTAQPRVSGRLRLQLLCLWRSPRIIRRPRKECVHGEVRR